MDLNILYRPQQLHKEYLSLIMKHDTLKASLERTVTTISLAPGHGNGVNRRLEDLEAEILDLEKEIESKKEELIEAQNKARKYIDILPDKSEADILIKRDVDCMTWAEISKAVFLNENYCREKHKRALKKLQVICG